MISIFTTLLKTVEFQSDILLKKRVANVIIISLVSKIYHNEWKN